MADRHSHENFSCQDLAANSGLDDFFILSIEISILVALSHLLHFFFKRFSQPSIVSQMFAGLLVGRSCLRRLISPKYKIDDDSHLISMASIGGTFFMFLVGLEMDFRFLVRSIRAASFITLGNTVTSLLLASIVGPAIYGELGIDGGQVLFVFILTIIFANTASPVLIHMMAELKMTMSEVGRLGISTALINDVTCLVIVGVVILFPMPNEGKQPGEKFVEGLEALILIVASAGILRAIVQLINRISKKRPAIRTITGSMRFGVNTFVLPIYFGYAGVQTDLFMLRDKIVLITVGIIVMCGTVGKVVSTLLVAKHLKMQVQEGVVLGFLLTVKGHVELIVITLGRQYGIFSKEIYQALLISMIFNNMTTGPTASYFVRRERCAVKHQPGEIRGSDEIDGRSGYGNCDAMMEVEGASDPDEEFMADVRNRFVSTRTIKYEEKIVEKSEEMLSEITSMEGMYSLFIVGRQRQGSTSQLTIGMSEPEDCQELGVIGNLLASSDFISTGSVLVVQQYCKSRAASFSVKVVPSK
ncbi:cation/H(+) antiporter 15-like [Asparagus officinalis]|uniref:cation/H(+) antiporter 15-like n=1 Tax=Asparagus officinalis TaxID=4686 RepID=UPI00098DF94D|nr:cation/H(+) antiporter 15-like [Asparagus officinalis]